MDKQDVFDKLKVKCPKHFLVNEIILVSYPCRRITVNITVNTTPDKILEQIYSVLLRTIKAGFNTDEKLSNFLGLIKNDIIMEELYFLRESSLLMLLHGEWIITKKGDNFIDNREEFRVIEKEQFSFLIDCYTGDIQSNNHFSFDKKNKHTITSTVNYPHKDPKLLRGKFEEVSEVYKRQNQGKILLEIDEENIVFDKIEYKDYFIIEYIPKKEFEDEMDPFIEFRDAKDLKLDKWLSDKLMCEYPEIIYQFTESDRVELGSISNFTYNLKKDAFDLPKEKDPNLEKHIEKPGKGELKSEIVRELAIWEIQKKTQEAFETVEKRLLVESPWIKKATLNYLKILEKKLEEGVKVVFIFGVQMGDELDSKSNDQNALHKLKILSDRYENFRIIHLPSHLNANQNRIIGGTHRKILIKDYDYYVTGSYNFLSFNAVDSSKRGLVSNEESSLINIGVKEKWDKIFNEYYLDKQIYL